MASGKTKKFKLDEAEKVAIKVVNQLSGTYSRLKICGSIRRRCSMVGDIDIVIVPSKGVYSLFSSSIDILSDEILANGNKIKRVMVDGIQIDFYICEEKFFGSHVLFLSGSKFFNIKCRSVAREMGYRLSQYGLLDSDGKEISNDEIEILEILGLRRFLNPTTRS